MQIHRTSKTEHQGGRRKRGIVEIDIEWIRVIGKGREEGKKN